MDDKTRKENEERIAEEYLSSLQDLNCNSKPLINMLTILAEENMDYAPIIVTVVQKQISQVAPDLKLPLLYLIDSIVKNVRGPYIQLFSQCIINIFCSAFDTVNEKVRERMYALRQTWNEIFSPAKLYALDVKVKVIDANWPITAKPPQPSIHVNPNFLGQKNVPMEILHAKTRELLELKRRKLELELQATMKSLEEQDKQIVQPNETTNAPPPAIASVKPIPSMPPTLNVPPRPNDPRFPATNAVGNVGGPPNVFNQNFRPNHPQNFPPHPHQMNPDMSLPQNQHMNMMMGSNNNNAAGVIPGGPKPKVNPVHPAMITAFRNRDPRLAARQQQQQNLQKNSNDPNPSLKLPINRPNEDQKSSGNLSNNNRSYRGTSRSRSDNERKTSPHRSSSNRSSSKSSSRDKDRDSRNKRSDSKNLASSSDRHRKGDSSSSGSYKNDKKSNDSSAGYKRKSASPGKSSSSKDSSKRSSKSKSGGGSSSSSRSHRHSSRSVSPGSNKSAASSSSSSAVLAEKRRKLSSGGTSSDHEKEDLSKAASILAASSVSKDLDKQPSSSTMGMVTTSAVALPGELSTINAVIGQEAADPTNEKHIDSNSLVSSIIPNRRVSSNSKDNDDKNKTSGRANEDELKKRIPTTVQEDAEESIEPLPKKTKTSSKMEMLFGEEDVDFRSVAPPPPMISSDKKAESWDNLKSKSDKSGGLKKGNSLEDVRAKLAKAAKYNKISKTDKSNKGDDFSFIKGNLLNINEDTLEANDEKIRTMIGQAQEMWEANTIDKDQFNHLVKTVMCINESNKLKAAQRLESLNVQKPAVPTISLTDSGEHDEKLAARQAVLKKRIPKIPKKINDDPKGNISPFNEASNSPLYDDGKGDEENSLGGNSKPKLPRERRNKSKWSDRTEPQAPTVNLNMNAVGGNFGQQRPWMNNNNFHNNMGNKRGPGPNNFRPNAPANMANPSSGMNFHGDQQWPLGTPMNNIAFGPKNIGGPNNIPAFVPIGGGPSVPPPPQPPALMSIPTRLAVPQLPKPCNSIDNPQAEVVRTITIDGVAKEIRIYDQIAIVFMDSDQPREIGFQHGQRSIFIDNQEPITLRFNDDYKPYAINGKIHRLRFGFPSRELYIDEHWYEIYFGGSAVSIPLGNSQHIIKAEGPPPQVNIGPLRKDLVVGKINMIVDAYTVVPLFLDARIQKCRLANGDHTVQFADNLLTIILDGQAYPGEYGGLPKSYNLRGRKFFIRFGALPKGVEPGKVFIKDMIYLKKSPPENNAIDEEELPPPPPIISHLETNNLPGMPSLMPQAVADSAAGGGIPALIPPAVNALPGSETNPLTTAPLASTSAPTNAAAALNNLNIDELFQKLVSSGILNSALPVAPVITAGTTTAATTSSTVEGNTDVFALKTDTNSNSSNPPLLGSEKPSVVESPQKPLEPIKPIDLKKPETIKTRQNAIVASLYSGMQCSSCGVRFPPEQTMKYSQHLDWHFRQNRRERDATRKAHFRKWYYDLTDWVQYEEIEDLDEREKNFFEAQQSEMDAMDETSNQRSANSPIPSCPAGPDDVDRQCDMCQEKFEQFYNEDLEEWHLRCAIRVENNIYHPLCYIDYKASLNPKNATEETEGEKSKDETLITDDDNAMDIIIKCETNESKSEESDEVKTSVTINDDDDDDDVIVLPNDEPSVTEIVDDDDEEYVPANVTREEMGTTHHHDDEEISQDNLINNEAVDDAETEKEQKTNDENHQNESPMEDDVEIQEPLIPFTDLDTYEEKELPEMDENSRMSFLNVKIKEEPKDDYEVDDFEGFEDVGTVLVEPEEEISLHDSEETQTQTISSTANSPLPAAERPDSAASQPLEEADSEAGLVAVSDSTALSSETPATLTSSLPISSVSEANGVTDTTNTTDTTTNASSVVAETTPVLDLNTSMDGDFETSYSEHNLSAAGPAPAIPIASLVNKIKINISKNTSTSNANSTTSSTTATASSSTNNSNTITSSSNNNSHSINPNSSPNVVSAPLTSVASSASTPKVINTITSSVGSSSTLSASSSSGGSSISSSSSKSSGSSNNFPEYSTIPVLCSGGSNRYISQPPPNIIPPMMTNSRAGNVMTSVHVGSAPSNISAISVIGSSYGSSNISSSSSSTLARVQPNLTIPTQAVKPSITPVPVKKAPTPPPVEETINYELKPALKEASLKKMKKIEKGIETSGLCSIM